jgi:integrase
VKLLTAKDFSIDLTDIGAIQYLLEKETGEKMKGQIRTKQKCPVCQKAFSHIPKIGMICSEHKTTPSRFFVDVMWKGQRIKVYSHKSGRVLDSYQIAHETLEHIRYEIRNHQFDPSKYVLADIKKYLFETVIKEFYRDKQIAESKGNISPSYLDSLKNYIDNYYLNFFSRKDVREIRALDIKDFYNQLPQRKEKTLKNVVNALQHFFNYIYGLEIIDRVPAFPIIRVSESVPNWISVDDQVKILNKIPGIHKPIFTFILFQGCRPSEARALKWKDLNFQDRIVIIRRTFSKNKLVERTKGRNVKPRMIHPYAYEVLKCLQRGLPEAFVFTGKNGTPYLSKRTLENIFVHARKAAGINITLYAAGRHSVATNAAMAGVDARIIRDYLGHADIRTTEIYTHLDVMAQKQIFEKQTVPKVSPASK